MQVVNISVQGEDEAALTLFYEEAAQAIQTLGLEYQLKQDKNRQGFVELLTIFLGSAFAVQVAREVGALLKKQRVSSVSVKTASGELVIDGITEKSAVDLFDELKDKFEQ